MNEKKLQRSESIKEKILVTAEQEFSEYGYFGARVDSIAARSGINKRIIYQYFESKSNLYSKVLVRVYERLAECERSFMTDGLSPIDAIRNIVSVSFKVLKDDPSFVRMLMWENLNRENGSLNESALFSLKKNSLDYTREQIKRGQNDGVFRTDIDIDRVTLSLNNFCLSYFSSIYTSRSLIEDKGDEEIDTYSSLVSDLIIRYLTK